MNIAVVIPSYKVKNKILDVIKEIGPEISKIYVVDDKCPEKTGEFVISNVLDPRVKVLFNEVNQGVGGAVVRGYNEAILEKMDVVVKIDGDGQMNPKLISNFTLPIILHQADYAKGNRFFRYEDVNKMPIIRLLGNTVLSFLNKVSTGYWQLFDPTNGFTAISVPCLESLDLEKVSKRYFFESDLLFRLGIIGACVKDVPMKAIYEDEESNLKIRNILIPFLKGHIRNFTKRITYDYFVRDFSVATISLVTGIPLIIFGFLFGFWHWYTAVSEHVGATSGTVMLAALPIIIGTQLVLNFLNYDMSKSKNNGVATFALRNN